MKDDFSAEATLPSNYVSFGEVAKCFSLGRTTSGQRKQTWVRGNWARERGKPVPGRDAGPDFRNGAFRNR